MYDLVNVKGIWVWNICYKEVFEYVKMVLCLVFCLLYLDFDGFFVLDFDVVDRIVGVVLL